MPDPATAAGGAAERARSTGGRTRRSTCCRCCSASADAHGRGEGPHRPDRLHAAQPPVPAVRQSGDPPRAAARRSTSRISWQAVAGDDARPDRTRRSACSCPARRWRPMPAWTMQPASSDLAKLQAAIWPPPATRARRSCCWRRPTSRSINAMAQVGADMLKQDRLQRRLPGAGLGHGGAAPRQQGAAGQGRLEHLLHLLRRAPGTSSPAASIAIRGNGTGPGSAGRPIPKLEALRDAWFDAPDLARAEGCVPRSAGTALSRTRPGRRSACSIRPRRSARRSPASRRATRCSTG